jgi:hypothetical protein
MSNTIKIKRGPKAFLPTLQEGELALCTDTNELYIGTSGGNVLFVRGLLADFTSSLTTNGYQKLPSGLILQWGKVGSGADGGAGSAGSVTFPIAFPNAVFSVNAMVSEEINNSGATSVRIKGPGISTTGFSYNCWIGGTSAAADYIYWIAIGC